ncbi:MAG: type II toxin-antitoxin system YhaV family toxin [Pseudanabaena sp. CAN_BIN31]|nr:type II toxin-antitoxin system YhaV family toxin [Pseudanabaena sp. CAN_BIN31]
MIEINGWKIYFHKIFNKQLQELVAGSIKFKEKDTPKQYRERFKPKLLKALQKAIEESIPNDPFSKDFELRGNLSDYQRVKLTGICDRYRLFFKVDADKKLIIILWLGYPRNEGGKNDCYRVFGKMVDKGDFPLNIEQLIVESDFS